MTVVVIDTNVLIVANGRTEQADQDCVLACLDALDQAQKGIVVLDDIGRILNEYMGRLSMSGQPGAGDAFFKWLHDHQADSRHCECVRITPKSSDEEDFKEFPDDPKLAGFHRKDRKFVAVARASRRSPRILNAVDRDWWDFREALKVNGVFVRFLCPSAMKRTKGSS
jgi:hypothetical protein